MDGDTVEERNLSHQRFALDDVGKPKVEVLSKRLRGMGISDGFGKVKLEPLAEDFTAETDISGYELVIVAVDVLLILKPPPSQLAELFIISE